MDTDVMYQMRDMGTTCILSCVHLQVTDQLQFYKRVIYHNKYIPIGSGIEFISTISRRHEIVESLPASLTE